MPEPAAEADAEAWISRSAPAAEAAASRGSTGPEASATSEAKEKSFMTAAERREKAASYVPSSMRVLGVPVPAQRKVFPPRLRSRPRRSMPRDSKRSAGRRPETRPGVPRDSGPFRYPDYEEPWYCSPIWRSER